MERGPGLWRSEARGGFAIARGLLTRAHAWGPSEVSLSFFLFLFLSLFLCLCFFHWLGFLGSSGIEREGEGRRVEQLRRENLGA